MILIIISRYIFKFDLFDLKFCNIYNIFNRYIKILIKCNIFYQKNVCNSCFHMWNILCDTFVLFFICEEVKSCDILHVSLSRKICETKI